MAVSDTVVENKDNLFKGTGRGYFKRTGETVYRNLGYLQLANNTPSVAKTDKYVAIDGSRQKITTFVDQTDENFALTLLEWTGKNLAMIMGGTEAAAFTLATTADTATDTSLDNIASTAGMVDGERYYVAGTGIAANTSLVFDEAAGADQTLDRATTATATGVSVTITKPVSFNAFDDPQVTGEFHFVSDNTVGPKLHIEARNAILTPNGTLSLLDSGATDPGEIAFTLDVYKDDWGKFSRWEWNLSATWVPVLA